MDQNQEYKLINAAQAGSEAAFSDLIEYHYDMIYAVAFKWTGSDSDAKDIAQDVKIQIEFNPKAVSEYRLIGYETRMLKQEDFKNDKVDAGDIGSGHTVTAIYEITPANSKAKLIDDLRYQNKENSNNKTHSVSNEYAFLKMRYKLPKESKSKLIELALDQTFEVNTIDKVSNDVRFAMSVAAFGQALKNDTYLKNFSYDDIIKFAKQSKGNDEFGFRSQFIQLVRLAKSAKDM